MPVYSYRCETCGADLDILQALGARRETCGLACLRRDSGPFGKGRITRKLTAANVVARRAVPRSVGPPGRTADSEALRERALERVGDRLTEGEIDKARKGGLTVYRHEGGGSYYRDGGDPKMPKQIKKPDGTP